jgi:peptidyl-prolyl cis-trans isomerase NIMA-interacting 1
VLAVMLSLAGCSDSPGATTTSASHAAPVSTPPAVSAAPVGPLSAAPPAPEEIAAQHILITYKGAKNAKGVTRSKDEAKKLAEQIHDEAAKGADFGALASQHSEDPASKERLGSLGKFKRSEMVKAFSDVAFALPVGSVSAVIETEFGFHVIKRNQ